PPSDDRHRAVKVALKSKVIILCRTTSFENCLKIEYFCDRQPAWSGLNELAIIFGQLQESTDEEIWILPTRYHSSRLGFSGMNFAGSRAVRLACPFLVRRFTRSGRRDALPYFS